MFKNFFLKGQYHGRELNVCVMFYRRFFIVILRILKKLVYTTIQQQEYYIFDVKNFTQNLRLTLDRVLHDHRVLVKKNPLIVGNILSDVPLDQDNRSKPLIAFSEPLHC